MPAPSRFWPLPVLFFTITFGLWADPPGIVGRLNDIEGTVSFDPGSQGTWEPAPLNYPLTTGDTIWSDKGSKAELQAGSTLLRLGHHTILTLTNLSDGVLQLKMTSGILGLAIHHLRKDEAVEVDTPNSSVSIPSTGVYRIDVKKNGTTLVRVDKGSASVTAGSFSFQLAPGQQGTVTPVSDLSYSVRSAPAPDKWDAWAQARDLKETQSASLQYVSPTVVGYQDLDAAGTWEQDDVFGWTWAPTAVAPDWAPYHYGHWAWVTPWGWTWVDDATWGFAPFHYGRWAQIHSKWRWIPGERKARQYWAPALVAFEGTDPRQVGWFPLGPHEVYVPPYTVGPKYFQTINQPHFGKGQAIPQTNRVYLNREAPRALTVIPREAFTGARPVAGSALKTDPRDLAKAPLVNIGSVHPAMKMPTSAATPARSPAPRPPAGLESQKVPTRLPPPVAPRPVPMVAKAQPVTKSGQPHPMAKATSPQQPSRPPQTTKPLPSPKPGQPVPNG